MTERVTLRTQDRLRLAAIRTRSTAAALILWLHGITVNKDEYLDFFRDGAEYAAGKGIDSLRIDFRGHGDSEGTSIDFSIVGQMLDVEAALKYLTGVYSSQVSGIYLVACSFGAPPALYAAIRHPDLVRGVILVSPVLSYRRTFLEPETKWAKDLFNPVTFAKLSRTGRLHLTPTFPIGLRLVEEMRVIRPDLAIREVTQPLLAIHGDADSMVPFDVSKTVLRGLPNAKFVPISNMDHGFTDADDDLGQGEKSLRNKITIYDLIVGSCL
jgi:uncharacterized protein